MKIEVSDEAFAGSYVPLTYKSVTANGNERNDLMLDLESLEEKFKALKIANTITGSENNINETRSEINSLIREIDLCISQLSE